MSIHQMALTDADKKEILSLLFKDELSASQNEKELLLSPRTDASWPLELPGFRFKKLTYEEEKQGSEYYEFRNIKITRDYVEISLSKGNYCKKVGTDYQFRKEHGKWRAKTTTVNESFTSGEACAGCKTGSGSVYKLKTETAVSKERASQKDLLLTGKVLATSCERTETKYVRCKIELSLDFVSQSNQPIIILQPHGEYEFWQGARLLALTKAESEAHDYVYRAAAWPSFYKTDLYRELARELDQAIPPANLTRVIAPGDSWNWKTTIQLGLAADNTCSESTGVEIGWKEIKKLSSPVWLRVSYEMWPFNVENFRKDLGGQLRERWKKHGTLYLEEKNDQFWFAHLTSEPISLDFQHVQLN